MAQTFLRQNGVMCGKSPRSCGYIIIEAEGVGGLWYFLLTLSIIYILNSLARFSDPLSVSLPFASYLHLIWYLAQDNLISFIIGNVRNKDHPVLPKGR